MPFLGSMMKKRLSALHHDAIYPYFNMNTYMIYFPKIHIDYPEKGSFYVLKLPICSIFVLIMLTLNACAPERYPTGLSTNPFSAYIPPSASPPITQPENLVLENNGNADVEFVRAIRHGDGSWTFHVTVRHPDQGWEDYSDGWDIVMPDGQVLKPDPAAKFSRPLLHPHVEEQPFTRSLSGVILPAGIDAVLVRAHDITDGFGGQVVIVDLREQSGSKFTVEIGQ